MWKCGCSLIASGIINEMPVDNHPITVSKIDNRPSYLEVVKALWRTNSKYLGMFPEGAFDEYANRGWILVAEDEGKSQCVGYLLYRITSKHIAIAHLCVDAECRGKGVAKTLFQSLVGMTQDEPGISVRCRRDFLANAIWPRLGFVADGEQVGRGREQKIIDRWWYPQAHQTLFSEAAKQIRDEKISVVMDANVLFDQLELGEPKAEASQALLADWLQDSLELFVTDEVFTEIRRRGDCARQKESHTLASSFLCLPCDSRQFNFWHDQLRVLFPDKMTKQDESDLRQVARAIGGEAQYMVTRDGPLLSLAADIEESSDLRVLHPADLITKLDEIRRESVYQPARFLGSSVEIRAIHGEDASSLSSMVVQTSLREKKKSLESHIRRFVSQPDLYNSRVIIIDSKPAACVVVLVSDAAPKTVAVPLLRSAIGPSAATVIRQLVRLVIRESCRDGAEVIRVEDDFVSNETESALYEFGFAQTLAGWVKVNLYGAETRASVAERLRILAACDDLFDQGVEEWADFIESLNPNEVSACCDDELRLWPVKFSDVEIPCYIVPIKPRWAAELFDDRLASQALFCRRDDLAMNVEAVYYRSAYGITLQTPARILWYVSDDEHIDGSKCIRACSYLDEVAIGKPKDLFRRFKRLGVYEWSHVLDTAKDDIGVDIMAMRFGRTQLLSSPIRFERIQKLLDKPNQLQSPLRISQGVFVKIYEEASR